jgi:hypothetical protein
MVTLHEVVISDCLPATHSKKQVARAAEMMPLEESELSQSSLSSYFASAAENFQAADACRVVRHQGQNT